MPFIVGVRFSPVGKIYFFEASKFPDLAVGDMLVVETSRGWQVGNVAQLIHGAITTEDSNLKSVDRRATPRDLVMYQIWEQKVEGVVSACKTRVSELKLNGVKVVTAEYNFDGSRLSIFLSSDTEEKVDLKSLRQDMQNHFNPSQVEIRMIGPRDVAKILGGMGTCGMENRCCSKFLTEFNSISIKMAKEQGISLTPSEITGMCGRLRCCLNYEYNFYCDAKQLLPKRNKIVSTPLGEGKVVDVLPLRDAVMVELPEKGVREFLRSEIDEAAAVDHSTGRPPEPKREPQKVQEPIRHHKKSRR